MSLDDPRHAGAPAPLGRQQPAEPVGRVENPATAAQRASDRVVPHGFSRGEDAIFQQQWGPQQPWAQQQPQHPQPMWAGSPQPAPSRARVPAALPLEGQSYAQVLRPLPRRVGRWFLAWAIAIGFFALGQTVALVLMLPGVMALFSDPAALQAAAMDPASLTETIMASPMAFLGVNLSWAAMIPGAVVALAAYGDRAMGFAFSVAGRWRWGVVGRSALVVGPIFALYVGLTLALEPSVEWRFQPDWLLVAIVVLTTPLQASGEEFAFRGIVTQQLGSWMRNAWVASLVTGGAIGIVFGLAHLGYPPLAMLQVALVGFTCAMLTFRTGGLEAACVLHTANNLFIMLPLALVGVSPFATSSGDGGPFWLQLLTFAACLAALGLSYVGVHLVSRRWQRRTEGVPGAETLLLPRQQPAPAMAGGPGQGQPMAGYGAPGFGMPQQHDASWAAPGAGAGGFAPPPQQPSGHQGFTPSPQQPVGRTGSAPGSAVPDASRRWPPGSAGEDQQPREGR